MIPNPRINCRGAGIGKIEYQVLMNNADIEVKVALGKNGRIIESETDPLIVKYHELNKKYGYKLDNIKDKSEIPKDLLTKYQQKQMFLYGNIIKEIKDEFNLIYKDDKIITDILVKYLYFIKPSRNKTILWLCYGDYIFDNIKKVIKPEKKEIQCIDCGKWVEVNIKNNGTCRCNDCYEEYRRNYCKQKMRKKREISKC